jgi:hypothetical protein
MAYTITYGLHPNAASCDNYYSTGTSWDKEGNTFCTMTLFFYGFDEMHLWITTLTDGVFPSWMELPGPPEFALEGRSPGDGELNDSEFETQDTALETTNEPGEPEDRPREATYEQGEMIDG